MSPQNFKPSTVETLRCVWEITLTAEFFLKKGKNLLIFKTITSRYNSLWTHIPDLCDTNSNQS
jgi:hypothetical protein